MTNAGARGNDGEEQRAYGAGLLAEIRAERARARRWRWRLRVRRAFAVFGRRQATRRRLTRQLGILTDSLERARLAETEVRERISIPDQSFVPPQR